MSALIRFLGDSPLRVIIKLAVVSFFVGLIMSVFDWSPWDIYYGLRDGILRIWNMGFDAIAHFAGYILLGAAIVVPIFLILRVLSYRR